MNKGFSKKDLRTGHIVRFRDEETAILIGDEFKNCWFTLETILDYYNDELFYGIDYSIPKGDIMEVYKMNEKMDFGEMLSIIYDNDNFLEVLRRKNYVGLIWRREETAKRINWNKVPKWTRILYKFGEKNDWERGYFLGTSGIYYTITLKDEFIYDGNKFSEFDVAYIKPFDEKDIKEEWYK